MNVYNAGEASAAVMLRFGPNSRTGSHACATPAVRRVTLARETSATYLLSDDSTDDGGTAKPFKGCRYVGAVTVTGPPGSRIAAIVNQVDVQSGGGDLLSTYTSQPG